MDDGPVLITLLPISMSPGQPIISAPPGTTIDGAIVALCPAGDGTVTADVCIDGPPVP